jgi:hypothetical protein
MATVVTGADDAGMESGGVTRAVRRAVRIYAGGSWRA